MSTTFAPPADRTRQTVSLLTGDDLHLFNEGTHYDLWKKLGAHVIRNGDTVGTYFAVWAPNARSVFVIGDFNKWNKGETPLSPRGSSGIWEGFVPGLDAGAAYKYHIVSRANGYEVDKADPFAFREQPGGGRASVVWDLAYDWQDNAWMASRNERNRLTRRFPSTKCTSVRGCACRRKTTGRSTIASWRQIWSSTSNDGLHARRVHADHGAPVLRLMGLSDDRLLCSDAAAMGRRRTSCTSIDVSAPARASA